MFNLTRAETALLCVLLLRGAQTPGELRGRSERMFEFSELSDVQSSLQRMMQREPPLVKMLPRQPGTKESRYAHLLSGDVAGAEAVAEPAVTSQDGSRMARLEAEIEYLKSEFAALQQQFAEFRKQFE